MEIELRRERLAEGRAMLFISLSISLKEIERPGLLLAKLLPTVPAFPYIIK